MNLLTKSAISILFLFSTHSFAETCLPTQKPASVMEYKAREVGLMTQKQELLSTLKTNYCFNKSLYSATKDYINGIYFAQTPEQLNDFLSEGASIDTYRPISSTLSLDLLSNYMLYFNYNLNISEAEKKDYSALQSKYIKDSSIKLPIEASYEKRKALLTYVARAYTNKRITTHMPLNLTPYHVAVLTNDYFVLDTLLADKYSTAKNNLYKKNSDGVTPFHMAFATKIDYDSTLAKENQAKTNDFLISNLEPSKIRFLTMEGKSFLEFVNFMKDNNIDFYNKLHAKYKFSTDPGTLPSVAASLKASYNKRLNPININRVNEQ